MSFKSHMATDFLHLNWMIIPRWWSTYRESPVALSAA